MEQKCSPNRIISLHLQRCSGYCSNASSCYHLVKNTSRSIIENYIPFVERCIKSGAEVHDSVCEYQLQHYYWLSNYPNYNITISCDLLESHRELLEFKNQLQVTVYEFNDLIAFKDYQKLFLIKDIPSLEKFRSWLGHSFYGKLHFLIDQNRIKVEGVNGIVEEFNKGASKEQTLDSCLTSYLINGECPYNNSNYIDITYDLTLRKCPYAQEGISFNEDTPIDELFNLVLLPKCNYTEYFEEN